MPKIRFTMTSVVNVGATKPVATPIVVPTNITVVNRAVPR